MKKGHPIIQLFLILCFLLGCGKGGSIEELDAFKARSVQEATNKALVIQYIDTLNAGDFESLWEFLDPGYAIYSPSGYPQPTSREKLIENYKEASDAFTDSASSRSCIEQRERS